MADEKALEGIARVVARRLTQPLEDDRGRDALLIIRAVVNAARLSRRLSGREKEKPAAGPRGEAS
jgi:hypothetical protein